MGASTSSCAARFLKKILTMNILVFLVPLLVVINLAEAKTFAEQLAVFVNETPNGFTVSKLVKNGQNCHCRVPASSSSSGFFSSSSSSQLAPTTAGGSSVVTTAANGALTGTTGSAAFDADTTVTATVAVISAAADYDTGAGSFAAEDTLPGSAAEDALPASFRRR